VIAWFLLAASVLLVYLAAPCLYGLLAGLLTTLTPGVKRKVKVARFLVATPFRVYGSEAYRIVAKRVEWEVRARCGPAETQALYRHFLERLEKG
jgi:hypothetical protein